MGCSSRPAQSSKYFIISLFILLLLLGKASSTLPAEIGQVPVQGQCCQLGVTVWAQPQDVAQECPQSALGPEQGTVMVRVVGGDGWMVQQWQQSRVNAGGALLLALPAP